MGRYAVPFFGTVGVLALVACATGELGVDPASDALTQRTGDAGSDAPAIETKPLVFDVGGTVSGLAGSGLVLQNAGGDDIVVSGNGKLAIAKSLPVGSAYDVHVKAQPTDLAQVCTVANGKGTVGSGHVENVAVACVTSTFTVGGTVSGLAGSGLLLRNDGSGDLAVASNGTFTFPPQSDGSPFAVSVKSHPKAPEQACVVAGGTGTIAGGNVTSINVSCENQKFALGGTVSGLQGTGLVLQNNGGDDRSVSANGTFAFATTLADLAPYAVTVKTQPTSKAQTCAVTNGAGNVGGAAVSSVAIACVTNRYKVNVTVAGLEGKGLVLQNNGGNELAIGTNGTFEFTLPVASGSAYLVTTKTNPLEKSQVCTVSSGGGIIGNGDASVSVSCTTSTYSVGGTVSGLIAGSVLLTINGGGDVVVGESGPFSFGTGIPSGSTYSVAVKSQPADRECVVSSGTGTVGSAAVSSVSVACAHAGCRVVGGLLWCKDAVSSRSCNAFCSAIGLASPTLTDAAWTAAQDTVTECSAIASAFGYGNVSLGAYAYACAEVRESDFACSTTPACPASHRTGSDSGAYWAVCPCAPTRVCGAAEEDLVTTLTCPSGSVIKSIDYASYGMPNGACGSYVNAACHAPQSKAIVEARCLGKSTCTVPASNDLFGDPCANVNKRVYVQASCQ